MKNVVFSILLLAVTTIFIGKSFAQEPQTIPEKEVPKKVIKNFKEKHPNITDAIWYPYPNRYYKKQEEIYKVYPILWTNNVPEFYEVRFADDKGKLRKVFDRKGTWKITSRSIAEADLPSGINSQLADAGYGTWEKVSLERTSKSGETVRFYKIWLRNKNRKRILFFNDSLKLVKTLKWDDDTNFVVEANAKLKNAPGFIKGKRSIAAEKVPETVTAAVKESYVDIEIIEWVEYKRVYDPFQSGPFGFSYYDIQLPNYYQVLMSDDTGKLKATYNHRGELLEVAEVIESKNLPKNVRQEMKREDYKMWTFEESHDKIEIGKDKYVYRIFGIINNEPALLILDEKGKNIEL